MELYDIAGFDTHTIGLSQIVTTQLFWLKEFYNNNIAISIQNLKKIKLYKSVQQEQSHLMNKEKATK